MTTTATAESDSPNKKRARITNNQTQKYLTRGELAERWRCSKESVKRRQRAGLLSPVYLSERKLLYPISQIEALEAEGAK
jgi:hypothetical protein